MVGGEGGSLLLEAGEGGISDSTGLGSVTQGAEAFLRDQGDVQTGILALTTVTLGELATSQDPALVEYVNTEVEGAQGAPVSFDGGYNS